MLLVAADLWGTSWRPIFLVNVPIGIAGLVIARRLIPESRSKNPLGIDRWGTVLLAIALLSLLIPLTEGHVLGWPLWAIALLAVFPFAVAGFVYVERRMERRGGVPLLPPSVMRMPSVRQGLLVGMPFFVGFSAFMFVFAVTLQDGLHLGPMGAGLVTTSQQTAIALGVATLGTLFASAGAGPLGMKGAFVLVIGIQAVLTVGVITVARRLPDPRV